MIVQTPTGAHGGDPRRGRPDEEGGPAEDARRLTAISRALTYARSFEEVLDLTVSCAGDILGASRVVLMLNDEDDGLLRIRASQGIEDELVGRFHEPLDETLLARLEELLGPQARDRFLGVPLVVQGQVIGLLAVRREGERGSPADEEWLLSALADQAAVALESTRQNRVRGALESRLDELENATLQKDHALKVLSHDVRSPLSAVQSYAALMAGEILGPLNERQREAMERIRGIAEHLDSVVSTVLQLARLTEGPIDLAREPVRLEDVVERSIDVVRPSAAEAWIEVAKRGDPSDVVQTDPDRLRQVLVQLLDNAVKYSPDGSTVEVVWNRTEAEGGDWEEISVVDEGPGIPEDQHRSIFEPYVRRDSGVGSERSGGGMGLGLAIARSIVEHMSGSLDVESEPGRGSRFRIRIPRQLPGGSSRERRH